MGSKVGFSSFVIFFVLFFKIPEIDTTIVGWIGNVLMIIFWGTNINMFKCLTKPQYKFINIFAVLWFFTCLISSYVNRDLFYDFTNWRGELLDSKYSMEFKHVFTFIMKLFMCLLYYQYLNSTKLSMSFLKYLFLYLFIFTCFSNLNALFYDSINGSGYLVGNKFYVCYLNIFTVTIYYLSHPTPNRKQKNVIKALIIVSLIIAIKTKCSTVVVGSLLMYLFVFVIKGKWRELLYSWKTYLIGLVVFDLLFFFFTLFFIDNAIMQYIIVDILGEDMSLTGRLDIYASLTPLLIDIPILGYGIGNASMITLMNAVGPNAQNGLFNYILEVGYLGAALFFFFLFSMMKNAKKQKSSYPILCFIYIMLVLSSIEVTFSTYFFGMSLFLMLNIESKVLNYSK